EDPAAKVRNEVRERDVLVPIPNAVPDQIVQFVPSVAVRLNYRRGRKVTHGDFGRVKQRKACLDLAIGMVQFFVTVYQILLVKAAAPEDFLTDCMACANVVGDLRRAIGQGRNFLAPSPRKRYLQAGPSVNGHDDLERQRSQVRDTCEIS